MDPNETLKELRKALKGLDEALATRDAVESLVDPYKDYDDDDVRNAVERFQALDEWLSQGGFLPRDWCW